MTYASYFSYTDYANNTDYARYGSYADYANNADFVVYADYVGYSYYADYADYAVLCLFQMSFDVKWCICHQNMT